ncbi:hypothetical protein AB0F88_17220 [Streptosporangium sp. NPDC023963]|uniref:hypothetical protein n=1 Tax=Streptosporangium sp. NPDC023963 TaxID=3155608 RepID=UPI00341AEFA4
MNAGFRARVPGPPPIAYQLGDQRVLCAPGCLSHEDAQTLADTEQHVGDVHPWTVDLDPDEEALRCDGCGAVLLQAPPITDEDDSKEQ